MNKMGYLLTFIILMFMTIFSGLGGVFAQHSHESLKPKYEMRAAWISTVTNIDLEPGMDEKEYRNWVKSTVETLEQKNFNTIIFQVKPTADALYPSELAPWSKYITGKKQGTDPGYDPLEIMLEEAHAHGFELHAWINPYRVTMPSDSLEDLSEDNIAIQQPDWVVHHGSQYYLDPGIPGVQEYLVETVQELVENYDIDAVHMDDYFYPGPDFADEETYEEYGGEFDDIGDWRRDNVNQLVANINQAIKEKRNWVQFGISPSGIWRNKADDPTGSDTDGFAHYDNLFADSRQWIINGSIDYITPQLYWSRSFDIANYTVLMEWWSNQVIEYAYNHPVNLYIGMADYKVNNDDDSAWDNPREIVEQVLDNREHDGPDGQMHFTLGDILTNDIGYQDLVQEEAYDYKSLTPTHEWNGSDRSKHPTNVTLNEVEDGISISIDNKHSDARKYAIYRFDESAETDYSDPENIVQIVYDQKNGANFVDTDANIEDEYTYGITAISATGIESDSAAEESWSSFEEADKEYLEEIIEIAEEKDEKEYTSESFKSLLRALEHAKEVFANEDATQEDVDMAIEDLEKALDHLIYVKVDKSELATLVESAHEFNKNDYTEKSWNEFEDILVYANEILDDKDATENEVSDALTQLKKAIEQLEEKPKEIVDKVSLREIINKAKEKAKSDYTVDSWKYFEKVFTDAKSILANDDATQKEVDEVTEKLMTAMNHLDKVSDVKDDQKKENGKHKKTSGKKLPKTATNNLNFIMIGSLLVVIGCLAYYIGKKRKFKMVN